jgi:hypothetical protein
VRAIWNCFLCVAFNLLGLVVGLVPWRWIDLEGGNTFTVLFVTFALGGWFFAVIYYVNANLLPRITSDE